MAVVRPQVIALLVCDAVHRDPSTGKHFLMGCFNALTARSFPARHPHLAVHVAVTEGYGALRLEVRLARPDGETIIHRLSADVTFPDPRTVAELSFQFTDVVFPGPEEVRVQVRADDDLVMERRLQILPAG